MTIPQPLETTPASIPKPTTTTPARTPHITTPLLESPALSAAAKCRVFLKLESLQPSGSFKMRGIGHYMSLALSRSTDSSRVHFYSSSGGNAGLACVHAARFLGRPATVVVPESTSAMMVSKIRAVGAEDVVVRGASWKEADTFLRETVLGQAARRGEEGVYVPPFDHPDIWAGHESLVQEMAAQFAERGEQAPDAVVCSVGGGGLFCGVMQGVQKARGWDRTVVVAAETEGADSLAKSLQHGQLVTLPGITSQAKSLGAVRVADRCFDLAHGNENVRSIVLSDAEAAMGCWKLADEERLLVELACGVNVAVCFGGRLERALGRKVKPDDKVVIVVCGGSTVKLDMLMGWKQQYEYLFSDETNGM